MNKKQSPVERHKEDLIELKAVAEDVMFSEIYPKEPNQFRLKFENVYLKLNTLLANNKEITNKEFNSIIKDMRKVLQELMADFLYRSQLGYEVKEDGSIVVTDMKQAFVH